MKHCSCLRVTISLTMETPCVGTELKTVDCKQRLKPTELSNHYQQYKNNVKLHVP